jgi:hypothetical protein
MQRGLFVMVASLCALSVHAQNTGVQWQAAAEIRQRTLTERSDDGRRLLTERGPMARIELRALADRPNWPTFLVRAALAQGRLDYQGQNQGGVPLATTTRHDELEAGLHWRPWSPSAWGEIWLGVDGLRQRRDIASTPLAGGLDETSTLVLPGLRWRSRAFSFAVLPLLKLQLEAQWRTSASHRLSVDYLGAFDASAFDSGRRNEAALRFMATSGNGWHWAVGLVRVRQSVSASAVLRSGGAPVGTVREPALRIDDASLSITREF